MENNNISINIPAEEHSIWIPNTLENFKVDTHLTSISSINEKQNIIGEMDLQDKELELSLKLNQCNEVISFNLFTSFIKLAEIKISTALNFDLKSTLKIEDLLAKGVDADLDTILYSLGSVGRQNPTLLTDSLLTWRNIKCSTLPIKELRRQSRSQALLMERINLTVTYLTCRSLLEMLNQIKMARSLDKVGNALEELAFDILKTFTPHIIAKSSNHQVLYKLLGEFIKCLSNLRFSTMSDRFIALLELIPTEEINELQDENNLTLTIYTMKYLKLKIYPDDALEETSEFLLSVATFFRKTSHTRLKAAYAEAFVEMLMPLVQVVDAEVNFPILAKAIEVLDSKASKLLLKSRSYDICLPLMTSVIGLSQKEIFLSKWVQFFDLCCQKIKDKVFGRNAQACLSRLLWVYLFRYVESSTVTHKRLDTIFRTLFSSNPKRQLSLPEGPLHHFYYIIYYVASYDLEYFLNNYFNLLIQLESTSRSSLHSNSFNLNLNSLDNILPDRFTLCLRGILLLILDHFNSIKVPSFPHNIDFNFNNPTQLIIQDEIPNLPLNFDINFKFPVKVQNIINILLEKLDILLPILESSYGSMLLTEEKYLTSKPKIVPNSPVSLDTSFLTTSKDSLADLVKQPYNELSTLYVIYSKDKQPYFDLIISWLDCLPLFIPPNFNMNRVIEWIIKLTYHIDPQVVSSAGNALKRICHINELHIPIIKGLSKIIKNIHVQYSELISPINELKEENYQPNLLNLYLEILNSWLNYFNNKQMIKFEVDTSIIWNLIEEVESLGILFLASPLVSSRKGSFKVLKVISEIEKQFDKIIKSSKQQSNESTERNSIYDFLISSKADQLINQALNSKKFSSKFLNRIKSLNINTIHLAATDNSKESQILWNFIFPKISKILLEIAPITTVLCRHMLSYRLKYLYNIIGKLSEKPDNNESSIISFEMYEEELYIRINTSDDLLLAHWGQYLTFICSTITLSFDSKPEPSYRKKDSKSNESINSAKDLFRLVLVLLSCENRKIRSMIVSSLCYINHNIYRLFIEDLQPFMRLVQEDTKTRILTKDFKSVRKQDMFREGITQCLAMTADILQDNEYLKDFELSNKILEFLKDILKFLNQPEVQADWKHQELRIYFCELSKKLYTKLLMIKDPKLSMSFELRYSIFSLAEKWCGHGHHRNSTREREVLMMKSVLEHYTDVIQRGAKTLAMEDLRKSLELSALNLMATLCKGPISISEINSENEKENNSYRNSNSKSIFNLTNLFNWIESIFNSPDKRLYDIGNDALNSLLNFNLDNPLLFEKVLHHCYTGDPNENCIKAYLLCLGKVLINTNNSPITTAKKLALICFKCGDASPNIRTMACKMLRHHYKLNNNNKINNKLDYLCELIVHPLASIYESARFKISDQLALSHSDLVLEMFSEIIMRLPNVLDNSVSSLLKCLIPWIKELPLSTEPNNNLELTCISHAIINNLLFLVVKYSDHYSNEIEEIWKALFYSEENQKSLEAVVQCLIQINISKRNPNLIFFTKNIFVYLSHTKIHHRLLNYLIDQLTPDSMVPQKKSNSNYFNWDKYNQLNIKFYILNLDEMILTYTKKAAYSKGQLILIFISDMILSINSFNHFLPLLLHLGSCQAYDNGLLPNNNSNLCQPILPNLLLALLNNSQRDTKFYDEIENLFYIYLNAKFDQNDNNNLNNNNLNNNNNHLIHSNNSSLSNNEISIEMDDQLSKNSSSLALLNLTNSVIEIFSIYVPDLMEPWSDLASKWSTSCPIRSVAKASFKIYRSFNLAFQPKALVDILTQLANTISDTSLDLQNFVKEIFNSLEKRIPTLNLSNFLLTPALFWFLIGCLNSYNEMEYFNGIKLLKLVITQLQSKDIYELSMFLSFLPDQLYLSSIEDSLLIGLASKNANVLCYELLFQFTQLPLNQLIIDIDKVNLAIILYSLPYLVNYTNLNTIENQQQDFGITIDELLQVCENSNCENLANIISTIQNQSYRNEEICLRQLLQSIRTVFFPNYEKQAFILILNSLSNFHNIDITKRRLKLLKCLMTMIHQDNLKLNNEEFIHLLPLLSLINGPLNEFVLETIEDILSNNNFIFNNQNNKLGLWKVNEDNNNQDKLEANLFEGKNDLNQQWAIPIVESRMLSTRKLLASIAQVAQELLDNKVDIHSIKDNKSLLENKIAQYSSSPDINTFGHVKSAPVIQFKQPKFFPPKMTDFYTENSIKHHRSKSSNTSILDYYGFKIGPLNDIKDLKSKFEGLEEFFQ